MELSERKKRILKAIVDDYIASAEPVGSKSITLRPELNFSSATIRNEMAELEEMGYLEKPYTSSGRIPSPMGYRLYVNELMSEYRLSMQEIMDVKKALTLRVQELDRLISEAGRLISDFTNHTTVATSPRSERILIRRIDIVPVDSYSFVIILVTSAGIVHNKLIRLSTAISEEDFESLGLALNHSFSGVVLSQISKNQLEALLPMFRDKNMLFSEIAIFLSEVIEEQKGQDVYLGGASRLLIHPEYHDVEKAHRLLDYISDRRNMTSLKIPEEPESVNITIGPENGVEPLNNASVVYTTYKLGDGIQGVIGIIGPTRMDYSKIAARLKYFSSNFNKLLSELFIDDSDL
ncbi:MAG: heat-inducible transcriptional repressor HrcA [Clostridiales bacterium]|nr:heat-inducible transcriptional repressor HrcA [Clostridiales bacterium]